MRWRRGSHVLARALALACLVAGSAAAVSVPSTTASTAAAPSARAAASAPQQIRVGTLTLRRCQVVARAYCGSLRRAWEPGDPSAGTVRVGFAFVRARHGPAVGTLVPHEGGPGYPTTGSGSSYVRMYGDLMDRRNLLLLDQRGTGRSEPIDCPRMQKLTQPWAVAAGRCGRSLGDRADDYSSALAADDLAAVLEALELADVDLYGDSYGTFFNQVFVGRHPDLVRSVVLDSSYPTYGESGWYPTSPPAARHAFRVVCRRSPECRRGGRSFGNALSEVLERVRDRPWRGRSHDADGRPMRVKVGPSTLVDVVYVATYAPAFYRELTAALRSGLRGDRVPLLRLVAEATGGGTDNGPARWYSGGLEAAVSCHDYAYVYDRTTPPGAPRIREYQRVLRQRSRTHPGTFAPFTVHEYARSGWQGLDWCTRWPRPPADNPAGPPRPPGGSYPDLPVLVLAGELDTVTTPAEGRMVRDQLPGARMVTVRNSFHVTAMGDTDHCAVRMVRAFVRSPGTQPTAERRQCAREVERIRAPGVFPRTLADVRPTRGPAGVLQRRAATAAAATVADLQDRWWNNYSLHGVGLRGGTWTYRGDRVVTFRLDHVRQVSGLAVSGTAVWDRYGETARVDLRLSGAVAGRLRGTWDTRARGATAVLRGRLDGERVRLELKAP